MLLYDFFLGLNYVNVCRFCRYVYSYGIKRFKVIELRIYNSLYKEHLTKNSTLCKDQNLILLKS